METAIKPRIQLKTRNYETTKTSVFQRLKTRYSTYVQEQDNYKLLWYMKTVLIIPCVYMVISSFAMAELVDKFEYWIGFTVLLFYTNIMIHVIELRSKVYVPAYYITLAIFILVPLITFIITQAL